VSGAGRDPPIRIPVCSPVLGASEERNLLEAVRSGFISSRGPFVARFEEGFARFVGARHAVAVSSGTAALHLAFVALGIGPGDEVVVPSFAMIACANAVTYTGARPVVVDAEPATWNLDPERLESVRTERTRAVLAVHTYGHPADMDPIRAWAEPHGIAVVEDAAEAHGAEYRGRRVGTLGEFGCFSFYANKILTTGEGGMVVTDRPELAERVALLRDQGFQTRRRFLHEVVGYNYRLTNLQAAIGVAQLERADAFVAARREHAARYRADLAGIPGLELAPEASWARNVFWMYSVRTPPDRRDAIADRLRRQGIETRPFFVPIHQQPVYAGRVGSSPCPVAEALGASGLNLPSGSGLTRGEVDEVAAAVRAAMTE